MKFLCLLLVPVLCSANVHPERAAMINAIHNTPGVLWRATAHPRFASQPPGASKSSNGVKGDWQASVEAAIANGKIERLLEDSNMEIPENFDSETNWPECAKIIGDIRDQSNCGCCWAFAGVEAASDRMCISTKGAMMFPLSAQDVCFNDHGGLSNGCNGGMITTPWEYIKATGAVTGGQYHGEGPFGKGWCSAFSMPHCHHHGPKGGDPYPEENAPGCPSQDSPDGPRKCDVDANAPHSNFESDKYTFHGHVLSASGETSIQQMIMSGGPVETAFSVYSDFENYAGGIYHHVNGSRAGGHAVKMVGWGVEDGVKYWKVANSWNPYWGEKGYFRILRGNNEGGIENSVIGSDPVAKWSKKGPSPAPFPPSPPSPGSSHYDDPKDGCQADEQEVHIQGVKGAFCSPPCSGNKCPSDVPTGVTAKPQCALQDQSRKKFCALICIPGSDDAQCGTATCKSVQGQIGLCTYDDDGPSPMPPSPMPPSPMPPSPMPPSPMPPSPPGQCMLAQTKSDCVAKANSGCHWCKIMENIGFCEEKEMDCPMQTPEFMKLEETTLQFNLENVDEVVV